jgi:glutathione S-transferase
LIGQGRRYFEAAQASPERAAVNAVPGEYAQCEDLLYVANRAYEAVTGKEDMPRSKRSRAAEPAGVEWDEDKVEKLFPQLAKRFEYGDV